MIDWEENKLGSGLTGRTFGGFLMFDIERNSDNSYRVTIRGSRVWQSPLVHKKRETAKQWCEKFIEIYTAKAKKQ